MGLKGQVSLEFLASMFIFLIGVGGTLTFVTADLPDFRDSVDSASRNLDATKMSNRLLTQPGNHDVGSGGSDWEKNATTRRNIEAFGFASDHLMIQEDKVQAVQTVGTDYANYSRFRNVENPDYQYNILFTWFPMVHTTETFQKGNPPTDPPITAPSGDHYQEADMRVHYGSVRLHGTDYRFLTTSHLQRYNATYVSTDWNFDSGVQGPLGSGDTFDIGGEEFEINAFQNRGNDKGDLLVLRKEVNQFGASIPQATTTIKLNRYGVYNASRSGKHPMRIEVVAW